MLGPCGATLWHAVSGYFFIGCELLAEFFDLIFRIKWEHYLIDLNFEALILKNNPDQACLTTGSYTLCAYLY